MMKYGLMFLYERDCGCFGGMLIVNAETDITCVFKKKQRREPTGLCVGYGNESSLTDDYTCLCLRLKVNIVVLRNDPLLENHSHKVLLPSHLKRSTEKAGRM